MMFVMLRLEELMRSERFVSGTNLHRGESKR